MKQFILSIFIFATSYSVHSQCEGRYAEELFSEVYVETHTYSDVYNLKLDVYQPIGDIETSRPLLIMAHGGTFVAGTRTNPSMVSLGNAFAKRGYVVASISYRLMQFWELALPSTALNGVARALGDGRAAVRYFRKTIDEGNPFGIDDEQIYFGGNSAGGVIALHAAFMQESDISDPSLLTALEDNGGIEGDSGNQGYSSHVKGAISLAGALANLDFLDVNDFNKLLISCHGNLDTTVPFDCGYPLSNPALPELCGGGAISEHAALVGYEKLKHLTFQGSGHVPWEYGGTSEENMINHVSDNLYQDLDCYLDVNELTITRGIELFPNPSSSFVRLKCIESIERLVLTNINGQILLDDYNMTNELNIEKLPQGIYFIEAYAKNRVLGRTKFIKI